MKNKNLHRLFDYLGFPTFLYIFFDSLFYVLDGQVDWRIIMRLIIGTGGSLIDGYLVLIHKDALSNENVTAIPKEN